MAIAKRIVKWMGAGLALLLVAGLVYQQIGLLADRQYAPPPADIVNVNGLAMHVVCAGQGTRAIVLDSGAGAGAFEWFRLQPLLAKSARVCAFDRAGLGWSDAAPGYDALSAADRLHAMAKAARIPTPFVYVGHSLGANFGAVYASRYSKDVSALVMLEPGVPADLLEDFHGTRADAMAANDCGLSCRLAGAATAFGIVRFSAMFAGKRSFDEKHRASYRAYLARPGTTETTLASINALPKTAYEFAEVKSFGAMPVLVVASEDPVSVDEFSSAAEYRKWKVTQRAYFASLAAKSLRGEGPVMIPHSDHTSLVLGERQAADLARTIEDFLQRSGM